jgi:translation initiation factor IF-3
VGSNPTVSTSNNKNIFNNSKKNQKRVRINQWIRISPIRLIDENGKNVGVVETPKALEMAKEKELDLIEIVPNAKPPVCRIMDYGKYQYQKSREEKKQKSKQKKIEVKGIRISLRTGQHDLEIKAKRAEKFLSQGHKVRIEMILRGREKGLIDMAKEKLNDFINLIASETVIEQEIKKQPRGLSVVVGENKHEKTQTKESTT